MARTTQTIPAELDAPHISRSRGKSTHHLNRFSLYLPVLIFIITVLPLLLFVHRYKLLAEMSMDAGDSFYYLTIARNSLHTPFFTFDGHYPTNGFHPVWEYAIYKAMQWGILDPERPLSTLHRLYLANSLLLGAACALFASFAGSQLHRRWLAIPAICPGFLWIPMALVAPGYLSTWSFMNGMESSIEMLFMALGVILLHRSRSTPLLYLAAFSFGLMTLSRLDNVFFLFPILGFIFVSENSASFRHRAGAIAVPLVMLAAYILYNRVSVGVFLPTSGAVKAGWALKENLRFLDVTFLPSRGSWALMAQRGVLPYSEIAMRIIQMILPAVVCSCFLALRRPLRTWSVFDLLCAGVILKGAYNLVFVPMINQGFWYYGSSFLVANLAIAIMLDRALRPVHSELSPSMLRTVAASILALCALSFCVNASMYSRLSSDAPLWAEHLMDNGDQIRSMILSRGENRFIEMNDGEITYATHLPAMAGTGLALDAEATKALKDGHFLDLAKKRGFDLIVASGGYRAVVDDFITRRQKGWHGPLNLISDSEFSRYNLVPVAVHQPTDTAVYRITSITSANNQQRFTPGQPQLRSAAQ